jgi:hypothetical protein
MSDFSMIIAQATIESLRQGLTRSDCSYIEFGKSKAAAVVFGNSILEISNEIPVYIEREVSVDKSSIKLGSGMSIFLLRKIEDIQNFLGHELTNVTFSDSFDMDMWNVHSRDKALLMCRLRTSDPVLRRMLGIDSLKAQLYP